MTPERYEKAGRLYHSALEKEPEARAGFLEEACGSDEELRREVESLLAAHEKVGDFFASPALEVAAGLLARQQNTSLVGQRLSHYRVLSLIGTGGMGEVYLAEDSRLGRKVALKLLPKEFTQDQQRLRRFEQEARAASALNHPNIITIYDIGQSDDARFMVTEFIEGETLRRRISASRPTVHEALDISIQVAGALAAAHEVGIIHRDIKPENIMLRRDGYVKVLDFGLAKLTEQKVQPVDSEAETVPRIDTTPGVVMGTVSYMSPEQARGQGVDTRTDLFSLGVVLYETVTGRTPFVGATPSDVMAAILRQEPPPLTSYLPEAPAALQRVVSRALCKELDERYQTAREMLNDLREVKEQVAAQARPGRAAAPELGGGATVATDSKGPLAVKTAYDAAGSTGEAARVVTDEARLMDRIRRYKKGALLALAIAVPMMAGIAFGVYRLIGQNQPTAPPPTPKFTRITTTGNAVDAAISPDGKFVVYAIYDIKDTSQQSLWLKHLDTGSNVQIVPPAKVDYGGLTFSPDGNHIYYTVWDQIGLPVLYQVPVLGGITKKLIVDVNSDITFSPGGDKFAFERGVLMEGGIVWNLVVANADGTGEYTLITRKNSLAYSLPAWSPDGKVIACIGTNSNRPTINVVQVEDGTERPLTADTWATINSMTWLSDGSGLVIAAVRDDSSKEPFQIWLLAYPGGGVRRVTNDLNEYNSISMTRDSRALVTIKSEQLSNIWVIPDGDADRARQITQGANKNDGVQGVSWTPDGRIVYRSDAHGNADIWIMDADGSNQKPLMLDAATDVMPSVSPDGRYVLFASVRVGRQKNIWKMDIDGANLKQLTDGDYDEWPHCSPDGKWVVYTSGFDPYPKIRKVPMDGGSSVPLSDKWLERPKISPDGKLIACNYLDHEKNQIAVIPFDGGEIRKICEVPRFRGIPIRYCWSRDGRSLIYIDHRDGVGNFWVQALDGGPPKQLTNFKSEELFAFDLSRDGKYIVCSRGTMPNDVVLIRDFK